MITSLITSTSCQCFIILFPLAYGGSNLPKCFAWGMCSLRAWHIPRCQHLSYRTDWLQTLHFSWMSPKCHPLTSSQREPSPPISWLGGWRDTWRASGQRAQFNIDSLHKLPGADSLAHKLYCLCPLWESRASFSPGRRVRAESSRQRPDWQYLSWSEERLNTNIQGNFNLSRDCRGGAWALYQYQSEIRHFIIIRRAIFSSGGCNKRKTSVGMREKKL